MQKGRLEAFTDGVIAMDCGEARLKSGFERFINT
jgi:hypothetical protein